MTKVRFGVVGASGIAERRTMPAFARTQHATLGAVCSRSLEKARILADQFGAPVACDDAVAVLQAVDAVYVATPVHCHLPDARKVLEGGKPLLIEKPLARTLEEAREILALARSRKIPAMEAYMMKFHPAHREIREAIQGGRLGRIVLVRARLGCWYPEMEGAWRQDPHLGGGGALMDLGSHLIDLLVWMLGPIRTVKALCSTQLFSYAVEDTATVLLEFRSGTHGIVEACFSMPDRAGAGVLEVIGTQGHVFARNTIGQDGGGEVEWEDFPEQLGYQSRQVKTLETGKVQQYAPTDLYAAQIDYFSQCILARSDPDMNGLEDGLQIMEWIEKAYRS